MSASHHIIYKTTCTATGKWYIGVHSTDVLDDGYLGSGIRLTNSVRKHGKAAHVREVIEQLPTREAAIRREAELVTVETLAQPGCMNLRVGGQSQAPGHVPTKEQRARVSEKMRALYADPARRAEIAAKSAAAWQRPEIREKIQLSRETAERRAAKSVALTERWADTAGRAELLRTGWAHREDSKTKMANAARGRVWVNRDSVSRRIAPEELATYLADGYTRGRAKKNA